MDTLVGTFQSGIQADFTPDPSIFVPPAPSVFIRNGKYEKIMCKGEIKMTKLNQNNYIAWAKAMEIMFDNKDFLEVYQRIET